MIRALLMLALLPGSALAAQVTPPGVVDPAVAYHAAVEGATTTMRAEQAACPDKACRDAAQIKKLDAVAAARKVRNAAQPAWEAAVAEAQAAYKVEAKRCQTLKPKAERKACVQANDAKYRVK